MFSFFKPVPQITAKDLKTRIDSKKPYVLIDVRSEAEYQDGHIAGSTLIPLQILEREIEKKFPKNETLYIHCHSGGRSTQAVHLLQAKGYTNVFNVAGGILAWENEGFSLVQ